MHTEEPRTHEAEKVVFKPYARRVPTTIASPPDACGALLVRFWCDFLLVTDHAILRVPHNV